ncbi:MAG: hypothetical protein VX579_02735, partial [Nitrospinota bacterium]|nr:hypothetical protein [Nitrospinota bacterium]
GGETLAGVVFTILDEEVADGETLTGIDWTLLVDGATGAKVLTGDDFTILGEGATAGDGFSGTDGALFFATKDLGKEVSPATLSKAIENQDFREENQPVGFVVESTRFESLLLSKIIAFGNNC